MEDSQRQLEADVRKRNAFSKARSLGCNWELDYQKSIQKTLCQTCQFFFELVLAAFSNTPGLFMHSRKSPLISEYEKWKKKTEQLANQKLYFFGIRFSMYCQGLL